MLVEKQRSGENSKHRNNTLLPSLDFNLICIRCVNNTDCLLAFLNLDYVIGLIIEQVRTTDYEEYEISFKSSLRTTLIIF